MQINHLGGENGHDRSYTTIGLGLDYKNWNLGTTYTHINNDADEADEGHDGHIYQVSVGYRFSNGLGLSIGYQKSDEENEEKERIGTLVSYSYDF
jgi:predicted porin